MLIHFHCWESPPVGFQPHPYLSSSLIENSDLLQWDNYATHAISPLISGTANLRVIFTGKGRSGKALMEFLNHLQKHPPVSISLNTENPWLARFVGMIPLKSHS
ncbi:hypothetical protein PEPS_07340 [Persicobacter psychrovividus]|uniref:Uncharacterized protein n=2 Tax=Persicobacter psychrovividus TaxID=387638 RepID=A0ABM7VCI6_9BACT|nr:hypothetical protein PEPS_07340 [Persicobacter psychrovividus]